VLYSGGWLGYNQQKLNKICFEDSKWLLVNIWTSIFLAAGDKGSRLVEPKTHSAKTAINSQGL
jgi:hypothetical protein